MLIIDKQRTAFIAGPGIHEITRQPNAEDLFRDIFLVTMATMHPLQDMGYTDFVFDLKDGINMIVAESILILPRIFYEYKFNLSAVTYEQEQGQRVLFPIQDMDDLIKCFYLYPHIHEPESAEELIPHCSHLLYYADETQYPSPELLLANEHGIATTNLFEKLAMVQYFQ